jgi:hypothetical protein
MSPATKSSVRAGSTSSRERGTSSRAKSWTRTNAALPAPVAAQSPVTSGSDTKRHHFRVRPQYQLATTRAKRSTGSVCQKRCHSPPGSGTSKRSTYASRYAAALDAASASHLSADVIGTIAMLDFFTVGRPPARIVLSRG